MNRDDEIIGQWIAIGLVLLVLGGVATAISHSLAQPGGSYRVWFGAMAVGAWFIVKAIFYSLTSLITATYGRPPDGRQESSYGEQHHGIPWIPQPGDSLKGIVVKTTQPFTVPWAGGEKDRLVILRTPQGARRCFQASFLGSRIAVPGTVLSLTRGEDRAENAHFAIETDRPLLGVLPTPKPKSL